MFVCYLFGVLGGFVGAVLWFSVCLDMNTVCVLGGFLMVCFVFVCLGMVYGLMLFWCLLFGFGLVFVSYNSVGC